MATALRASPLLSGTLTLLAALLLWQAASVVFAIPDYVVPAPYAVLKEIARHPGFYLVQSAVTLQNRYPDCHTVLVCSPSQKDEAVMRAEEAGLDCEFVLRPLSRAELLAQLATAPGVQFNTATAGEQLRAA